MAQHSSRIRFFGFTDFPAQAVAVVLCAWLAATFGVSARAQQDPAPQQASPAPSTGNPPSADQPPPAQAPAPASQAAPSAAPADMQSSPPPAQPSTIAPDVAPQSAQPGEITEDQVRKLLTGKELFLRGGYLDNTLSFNERGALIGHSPQGSYTLSGIEISKVHLARHKLELEGQRFGLHFLGALPYEDPTKAVDRVNITPKKKLVKITIDRELVVKPKQEKGKKKSAKNTPKPAAKPVPNSAAPATANAASAPAASPTPVFAPAAEQTATLSGPAGSQTTPTSEMPGGSEVQAEIAAAPPSERPADPNSVTTTTSPAHANKVLLDALNNAFAQGFDARMMDFMPGFWKLYYEAAAAKTDYRPNDPAVLRQDMVDRKARLTSTFEPASNEYAQNNGVAGISLYHVVIGADGKPEEIAVARPIGFGLDENAVDSIRKAAFEPAMKDGKPVPVLLDLVVEFHIYSKRTNVAATPSAATQPNAPSLPGPYSLQH